MPPRKKSPKSKAAPRKPAAPAIRPARKMPAFTKPSTRTLEAFAGAVGALSGVEHRTMFGYPSVFLNGNMLACVFQDRVMVRLSEGDRTAAMAGEGAKLFEPSPGRAMREYIELPKRIADDPAALNACCNAAVLTCRRFPKGQDETMIASYFANSTALATSEPLSPRFDTTTT